MKWALVDKNNMVQQLIVYDGVSPYTPPATYLSLIEVNDWVQIGDNANEPDPPPDPQPESMPDPQPESLPI